jgi:hypothetical protein
MVPKYIKVTFEMIISVTKLVIDAIFYQAGALLAYGMLP